MKTPFKKSPGRGRGPYFDDARAKICGELARFDFDYADTMHIRVAQDDRRTITQMMAARGTGHVEQLLGRFRDIMVRPFGLKPIGPAAIAPFDQNAETSGATILGVDDRHADVRLVYQIENLGDARQLCATSLVRTHGMFGKAYLMAILPFHFLIVRRQLERIGKAHSNHHTEEQGSSRNG